MSHIQRVTRYNNACFLSVLNYRCKDSGLLFKISFSAFEQFWTETCEQVVEALGVMLNAVKAKQDAFDQHLVQP